MIVVSDTTPLISLMKTGHLDLLKKFFGKVYIPEAVFHELTANPRFTDEAEQMQIKIMGTIGLLMASWILSKRRKPVKAGTLALTGFRHFEQGNQTVQMGRFFRQLTYTNFLHILHWHQLSR